MAEVSYSHGKMSTNSEPKAKGGVQTNGEDKATEGSEQDDTLKYQLLGPSLTKAGQDKVDQQKVRAIYPRTNILFNGVFNTYYPTLGIGDYIQRLEGVEILQPRKSSRSTINRKDSEDIGTQGKTGETRPVPQHPSGR